MSDITFMRGYGFPRGSQMDYAGYGGYSGLLVNNRRRYSAAPIPYVPEPSVFQKIPALDGFGGEEANFGTEYVFTPQRRRAGYGDMVLPTLDLETGEWEETETTPKPVSRGAGLGTLAAVGVGLWLIFGR